MKKISILFCITLMLISFCACGNKDEEIAGEGTTENLTNPITEVSYDELLAQTGITFAVPEGAENVSYSIINVDEKIAQMTFTLDGVNCTCRAQAAGLPEAGKISDISGMNYTWETTEKGEIFYSEALFQYNAGKEGVVGWYDYAPGILYSVSVDLKASAELLKDIAEKSCPPLQGETNGDETEETENGEDAPEDIGAPEPEGADLNEIVE